MPIPPTPGNESRFDADAQKLIEAAVKHEDVSKFQNEIQGMSNEDRLEFYQALNRQAINFTGDSAAGSKKGMGGMRTPFVDVEKVTDKCTGELVDMDLVIVDNTVPVKAADRVDIFDPSGGSGKDIDELQQGRRDAGAYVRMDLTIRSDETEQTEGKFTELAKKSRFTDAIRNRLSEEFKDPERHRRAIAHFDDPQAMHETYETESHLYLPNYSTEQLPGDFQEILREPARRVAERAHQLRLRREERWGASSRFFNQ